VVLKYRRAVIKLKASSASPVRERPVGVIEGSRADVSFVAGLLIDKFAYHLPLYRQHQRLCDQGIAVSRPWLTQLGQQGVGLLDPIYEAQLASIRCSRVKAMDETPIKAGAGRTGQAQGGLLLAGVRELDEVCFPFFESRRTEHVGQALGLTPAEGRCCCRTATGPMPATRRRWGSPTRNAGHTRAASCSRLATSSRRQRVMHWN
jgi:transposase